MLQGPKKARIIKGLSNPHLGEDSHNAKDDGDVRE